ncbi:hypothetical protein K7432_000838 [Basidiobolus ranarum]|uniref:Uncharacterized protein n=1 Tax=Basidiobolus ranarum TaxID=34480 RepID=A0ABR2X3Y5_9FUNG
MQIKFTVVATVVVLVLGFVHNSDAKNGKDLTRGAQKNTPRHNYSNSRYYTRTIRNGSGDNYCRAHKRQCARDCREWNPKKYHFSEDCKWRYRDGKTTASTSCICNGRDISSSCASSLDY